jgi:acetate---CoA ligase (ADP-forming)
VITTSGGVAALAADLAADEDAPVPPLDDLADWVRERVPGDTVNPLDLTGFVMTRRDLTEELFERYADAVDLLVLAWWAAEGDEGWSTTLLEPFESVAVRSSTPFLVSPVEATAVGEWTAAVRARSGVAFARGVQSVYRAVRAMNRHVSHVRHVVPAADGSWGRTGDRAGASPAAAGPVSRSTAPVATVSSDLGEIVRFVDAMRLLAEVGIAIAPFVVVDGSGAASAAIAADPAIAALGERLVVKLADVAHRTELGAVRVGVHPLELDSAVAELRRIAEANGVASTVVVQQMVSGHGEAFAGLQVSTDLGSVALLGMGGVLVEVAGHVSGRLLPFSSGAAEALVEEVAGAEVFARLRGHRSWDTHAVLRTIEGMAELWRRHLGWIDSVDVNPLVVTDAGLVAVDALIVVARTIGTSNEETP